MNATKLAMRSLARRVRDIDAELAEIDAVLRPPVAETAPDLVALYGVGPDTAGALVVAAGDNPGRLRNEATFTDPDRGASPLVHPDGVGPRTQRYVERRCKEGLTQTEAMRCLKRYVAREVFYYLVPLKAGCIPRSIDIARQVETVPFRRRRAAIAPPRTNLPIPTVGGRAPSVGHPRSPIGHSTRSRTAATIQVLEARTL